MAKRVQEWRTAFSDKENGIWVTLNDLLWRYAVFRIAAKIVQLDGGNGRLNQLLFDMIADGFWLSFFTGVRRLTDKGCLYGKDGVYSLRSVLNDVEVIRLRLDRRSYVEIVCGARFDLENLQAERDREMAKARGRPVWVSRDLPLSEEAHEKFDLLSGVAATQRSATDRIDPSILKQFDARLSELDEIAKHATKRIAHNASISSRTGHLLSAFNFSDAASRLKVLRQTAGTVGLLFANQGSGDLAVYEGEKFEGLDRAMVDTDQIALLEETWDQVEAEIVSWRCSPQEFFESSV